MEWGNTRCMVEFGPEWSWIEHHYQGGWGVTGIWTDQESLGLRGWTHITNQPSECFSTGGTTGVTWVHTPCTATLDTTKATVFDPNFDVTATVIQQLDQNQNTRVANVARHAASECQAPAGQTPGQ